MSSMCRTIFANVFLIVLSRSMFLVEGFSYNVNSKIVYMPERQRQGANFGYSVMMKVGEQPTILIGAPRDESNLENHKSISSPGSIYTCKFNPGEEVTKCSQLLVDSDGNVREMLANGRSYHDLKENMWLGMTLEGSDFYNDSTVMCAPRWSNQYYSDDYFMNGLCYIYYDLDDISGEAKVLRPLIKFDKQETELSNEYTRTYYGNYSALYSFGQAGFSAKLSDDGEDLLLGAPGIYAWTGSVVKLNRSLESGNVFRKSVIPNTFYTTEIQQGSYLGYSVGIGHFYNNISKLYVAGAPRGSNLKGEVYIFDFPPNDDDEIIIYSKFQGKQMGEYFGSTIATADIDGDGLTDLLVGAPMYAEKGIYDLGRLYIFINKDEGNFKEQDLILCGSHIEGARFGSTISVIGDLNLDGFTDVAVGAPYESNGMGAVYIYLGSKDGLVSKHAQRISFDDMLGFGISISKGVDIDDNSCNDITIGAYESNRAVLLRCHPAVKVLVSMKTAPPLLSTRDKNFTLNSCIKFEGSKYKTDLTVSLFIDEDYKRAKIDKNYNATFSISGIDGDIICFDTLVDVKLENVDYSRPIKISMKYVTKKDPLLDSTFCKSCTVIPPQMNDRDVLLLPFDAGCGADQICRPDLKLTVKALSESPYLIGSAPILRFNITVDNTGEPAYLAKINVTLPDNIPLLRVPPDCFIELSKLLCNIGNPLRSNVQIFLIVEFDAKHLRNKDRLLAFNTTTYSGGDEISENDNFAYTQFVIKTVADLTVIGTAEPYEYLYIAPDSIDDKKTIEHIYEINNNGPSQLESVRVKFFIPTALYNETKKRFDTLVEVYSPKVTTDTEFFRCEAVQGRFYSGPDDKHLDSGIGKQSSNKTIKAAKETNKLIYLNCTDERTTECFAIECHGALLKDYKVHVSLKMTINIKKIKSIINKNSAIILSTNMTLESEFVTKKVKWVTSEISGSKATAPFWIYFISLIVGIIFLAVIIYVLYKCDFFKRKEKMRLELLKNEDPNEREEFPID